MVPALVLLCAAVTEYLILDNWQRTESHYLTVLESGKAKIKVLASGEGLLAVSPPGGR